jgi:starch synthase
MTSTVLSVASEVYPLIKTGGLADVAGALPLAMGARGVAMRTLMPGYPDVIARIGAADSVLAIPELFGGSSRILSARVEGLDLLVLDAPHLYARSGGPYVGADGQEFPDNWARFAALSKAGALVAEGAIEGYRPDVLHAHDWQAALAPVYLAFSAGARRPKTVLTVHNLAFQGSFPFDVFPRLGLPNAAWSLEGLEYYGSVGFLKGGLHAADVVTTVSPTYAEEILTSAGGMGLDGLLHGRGDRLVGIVNGIDTDIWNPATDPDIARNYTARTLKARRANKRALETEFGLARDDSPILAVVSRLTWQKGMDVLVGLCDEIVAMGARLVVIGSGDRMIEGGFLAAHARHPGRVGVRIGYSEVLSHRLQAGADALLVPSRFEPCGLTQLYALRYGCIPVVARVGGLADTVIHANFAAMAAGVATGVIFAPVAHDPLREAVAKLIRLYDDPVLWQAMQKRGMATDVGWDVSAARYAALYRDLTGEVSP